MKVLWLSHLVPYPPKGGVLQRAYHLLHEVSKYHEVDLLAFHQPNLMRPTVASLEEGVRESKEVLSSFCHQLKYFQIDSDRKFLGNYRLALKSLVTKDPYTINWLKSAEYAAALQDLLETRDYDLVYLDTISLVPYFDSVKHLPTVLDHHNVESHMLLRRADNEDNALKKWYFRQEGMRLQAIEKLYCPQFTLNITCSEIDKQRLQETTSAKWVEEVPNGVDIEFFKPDKPLRQEKRLIFIGTLSWYPNVEAVRFIASELWPLLRSAIPDVRIDIIGAEPPEDIVKLSELEEGFNVHGFVDDILPYMDQAAIYVCPINDGGGTKLKILDALSMGMAVVAHPIACEGIEVEAGRNVMFAESVDDYIDAIRLLLNDPERRLAMGAEARELIINRYSSIHIGKALSALFKDSVNSFADNKLNS